MERGVPSSASCTGARRLPGLRMLYVDFMARELANTAFRSGSTSLLSPACTHRGSALKHGRLICHKLHPLPMQQSHFQLCEVICMVQQPCLCCLKEASEL